jgi:hypothetical protein
LGFPITYTYQKVIRFYIAMEKGLPVEVLKRAEHLICEHKNSFKRELAVAGFEKILKRRAEAIDHHDLIGGFGAKPAQPWNTDSTTENEVELGFVEKLRRSRLKRLELDRDRLISFNVFTSENFTETASTNASANAVLPANNDFHSP